jgi:outer membrane immunogenic protein
MKRTLVASLVFALLSGAAMAADLPAPAPAYQPVYKAPPPPAPTWTGCYIDGGGGYGLSQINHFSESYPARVPSSSSTDSGGKGWLGRFGGGCDYQFGINFIGEWQVVIGALADYDFSNIHGTIDDPTTGLGGDMNQSSAWVAGGRAGILVTPSLLTYFDGGFTQDHFNHVNLSFVNVTPSVPSGLALGGHTFNGWFIGGGTEYAFTWLPIPGLFWRTEYRYSTYNTNDVPTVVAATGALAGTALRESPQVQTILTSLVWRFNWSGNWAGHW